MSYRITVYMASILMSPQSKHSVWMYGMLVLWYIPVLVNYGHCPSASSIKSSIDDFGKTKVIANKSKKSTFSYPASASFAEQLHLLLEPWFSFWSSDQRQAAMTKDRRKEEAKKRGTQREGERARERERQWVRERGDPYRTLSTGQWISSTIQMYLRECLSDSLQKIPKRDNGPEKWVMLSFCWFLFRWSSLPPRPVYLY